MSDSLAGVVLAAGAGSRLRPLSIELPKPLCPIAGVRLIDMAIDRVADIGDGVAVNVHHGRDAIEQHLAHLDDIAHAPPLHISVEEPTPLGTAGALGQLREWLDGRAVCLTNADAWLPLEPPAIASFIEGWDGERVRLLCVDDPANGDFGSLRYAGLALMPWHEVAPLRPEPSGLYELSWGPRWESRELDLAAYDGPFVDCGTPGDYHDANMYALGERSIVDETAIVEGTVERSVVGRGAEVHGETVRAVVWPGASVIAGERLVDAIRGRRFTVLVR